MAQQPDPPDPPELVRDWTTSIAKYIAVGVLGAVSTIGIGWSILGRQTRPVLLASGESNPPAAAPAVEPGAAFTNAQQPVPRTNPTDTKVSATAPPALASPINLNTATAKELESLPGIGPALAARIIEDREKNGHYRSFEQLDRVKGIGVKTLDRLRPLVTVTGP